MSIRILNPEFWEQDFISDVRELRRAGDGPRRTRSFSNLRGQGTVQRGDGPLNCVTQGGLKSLVRSWVCGLPRAVAVLSAIKESPPPRHIGPNYLLRDPPCPEQPGILPLNHTPELA